jgi:hypothetical protein
MRPPARHERSILLWWLSDWLESAGVSGVSVGRDSDGSDLQLNCNSDGEGA